MLDLFDAEDGQTELTHEEREGLKLAYVTFRAELNAAEQANIASAVSALFGRRRVKDPRALADYDFLCATHRKMYGKVWKWAGKIRTTDKNIGVPYYEVHTALRRLIDDTQAWLDFESYQPDELAVRFHHRLVSIHPFPNGNGRLSRMLGDLMVTCLGHERFSWGQAQLTDAGATRSAYIAALQRADHHELGPLIAFARS